MVPAARLAQLITIFFAPVLAKIQWSSSRIKTARRLQFAASHADIDDAGCILGGYDPGNPSKIYVGGPCSALTGDMDDPEPTEDFKWIEMETVDVRLVNHKGNEADLDPYEKPHVHADDHDAYVEVGISSKFIVGGDYDHAGLFASTTSYLSRAAFQYKTNTFILGEGEKADTYQTVDLCIAKCCESPPCACSSECSDDYENTAEPGSFKYTILAAAFDVDGSKYESGLNGNGWERIQHDMGEGQEMELKGELLVYQVLDFTHMKADNLTITSPEGEDVMYADMEDFKCHGNTCTGVYGVENMTVEAGDWSVSYTFPQTYNRGMWKVSPSKQDTMIGSMSDTKIVEINCIKFNQKELKSMGIEGSHVVLLQYKFDATGISATTTSGGYMVYDPTVTGSVDASMPTELYEFEEGSEVNLDGESSTTTTAALAYQKVIGTLTLEVDNPEEFVKDPDGKARAGIAKSLAEQLTNVEADMIDVTLELEDARRLAAVRALAGHQHVLVTYVITLFASDASAAATLGNAIVAAIKAMDPTALQTSLQQAFDDAGLGVTVGEIEVGAVITQAVEGGTDTVTLPETPTPTPTATPTATPTPTPTPTATPTPTPTPTPSPLPESPSSPSTNASSSGSEDEEEDGSVRPGPACVMVFGLLALLRTTQA